MIVRFASTKALLIAVSLCYLVGCGQNEPTKRAPGKEGEHAQADKVHDHGDGSGAHSHDAHDVPITEADVKKPADFKDAIARIKSYRDSIERDTATKTPGLAHRSLDELDIVLKWLPSIARDSNVPKSQWETVNTTSQELRGLFEKVHNNIDNKKTPDFPSVAKAVDEGIGRLETAAAAK
ncbi:MAG: hypothetical protein LLG00_11105 [Planctomycetaceae bacterium]|nr:hypothetical protein [Planctomycetaceae bacterium]